MKATAVRASRLVIAAGALAFFVSGANAQMAGPGGGGGSGGHKQHQQNANKADTEKPKADEKAYAEALKSLPNKPYDPWHGVR